MRLVSAVTAPVLAAFVALAATGCRRALPPPATCRDPLGGVWVVESGGDALGVTLRGDERLAFDVRDDGATIALYPLWDSSRPASGKTPLSADPSLPPAPLALSPWRLQLTRAGEAAVGSITWRVTQGGRTCPVKQPARLSGCQSGKAVLDLTLAAHVDASTCAVATAPTRVKLTLGRE